MDESIVKDVVIVLICVFVTLANLVVVAALIKTPQIHTPNNIFVAGMASADILLGLCYPPLFFLYRRDVVSSFESCQIVIYVLIGYVSHMSLYMVLGFTLNRFFHLRFPIQYERYVTCKRSILVVVFIWIVSVPLAAVPYFMMDEKRRQNYDGNCYPYRVLSKNYIVYSQFIVHTVGASTVLTMVNIYALCLVRRYKRNIARLGSNAGGELVANALDMKSEKYLMIIISTFLVCTLPINIVVFIGYLNNTRAPSSAKAVTGSLHLLNSFFNPFIYAWGTNDLKKPITDILFCRSAYECPGDASEGEIVSGAAQTNRSTYYYIADEPQTSSDIESDVQYTYIYKQDAICLRPGIEIEERCQVDEEM